MKHVRTSLRPVTAVLIAIAASSFVTAHASDYYLRRNQDSGWHWHTTTAGNPNSWHTTPEGRAVQATSMDPAGHYHTRGHQLRSPEDSGEVSFQGAKLILDDRGSLALKTANGVTARALVQHLETRGASTITAGNAGHYHNLTITTFDQAGTTTFIAVAGRSHDLTIGTLSGNGTLVFSGGSTGSNFRIASIDNAADFAGTFSLAGGTLRFSSNLDAANAALSLETGTLVHLTHSVTVSTLAIAGHTLGTGSYDYTYLKNNYGNTFIAGDARNGRIVVGGIPDPSTYTAVLTGAVSLAARSGSGY